MTGQMTSDKILIPSTDGSNLSHEFVVGLKPGVVRAFNLRADQRVRIEHGVYLQCMDPRWGPYLPCDGCSDLTTSRTALLILYSGLYRVYVDDPGELGIDDVVVVWHEQDVNRVQ